MLLKSLALASAALFCAAPCEAATLYVSATGGSSTCSAAQPCGSFVTALTAASSGDTIFCYSAPSGVGGIIITKSITIDCTAPRGSFRDYTLATNDGSSSGIVIDVAPPGPQEVLRIVRLRGLTIDGATRIDTATSGRLMGRGIEIRSAAAVYIEDCVITNVKQQGILDNRTGGQTKLFVKDSIFTGNLGAGIALVSQSVGITVLDNVRLENNGFGVAAASGNNVFINRSVMSGNSQAGVEADPGAKVVVSNSVLSHNNIGVQAFGSVRLRENDIAFSNTAIQGSTISAGANRFLGNGSIGMMPSTATGASTDVYN